MRRQLACNDIHVLAQTVLDLSSCVHIQHAQPLIALVGWDAASVLVTELAWMVPAHRHGSCIEFPRAFYGGTSYMFFASHAIYINNNTAIHSVRSSWTSIRMPPQMVLPIHRFLYLGLHRGLVFITISTHPLLMIQVMVMYL